MYYGNNSAVDAQNPGGVWNSHYRMVQHLDETSGTVYDSTSYGNNGTSYIDSPGSMDATGVIDGGDDLDGIDDYIEVPHDSSLNFNNEFTIELWAQRSDISSAYERFVMKYNTTGAQRAYGFYLTDGNKLGLLVSDDGTSSGATTSSLGVTDTGWHYVVAVFDSGGITFYKNLISDSKSSTITSVYGSSAELLIGCSAFSGRSQFFDGIIDEVRLSDVAQSSSWIKTCYHNGINNLLTVGSEEISPSVVQWSVVLNFTGPDGVNDTVVFGEASDASDGQDGYDVSKPDAPPTPYVYSWFDANLSEPYDALWEDYRSYPDTFKVWDMYVKVEDSGYGDITISWDPAILMGSEYSFVTLKDFDTGINTNMLLQTNYTYNASDGVVRYFQIICSVIPTEYHYSVPLGDEWNLVSLPVNQSVHKNNITVNYLGVNYTWQQAVDNSTILGFIYGWNVTNQNYLSTDVLDPGEGYWMYVYHGCDLWISSNTSNNDNYITDLLEEWNLVGLPYDTSVAKEDLIVLYNGSDYTWQQAVDNSTILGFIYGWNVTNQNYVSTDVLDPGEGYWMYAYDNCILKKEAE